jgi:nitrogenase-stabilizing/protective protein
MSGLSEDLALLSSAEDFFAYFGLDYDPKVLARCRLHILRRFHDKLARVANLDTLDDASKRVVYCQQLGEAYAEFPSGSPEYVFPGLRRVKGAFVALSSVHLPKASNPGAGSVKSE